jgi:hypothetical protein
MEIVFCECTQPSSEQVLNILGLYKLLQRKNLLIKTSKQAMIKITAGLEIPNELTAAISLQCDNLPSASNKTVLPYIEKLD